MLMVCCCTILQLREREARVGELVDMVVEGYHTGFAHSITSYSHILQLFQESRLQAGGAMDCPGKLTTSWLGPSRICPCSMLIGR
jgi:hypothetical protein